MFRKILIANRGEIASRVIRTAHRLGIGTVSIYSDADRDALHVQMADEAVHIGPAPPAQSYLDIKKIVGACRATSADAVHPGYGFLAERAEFPRALADAGVAFIGPNPDAIAAMGDKIRSKKMASSVGMAVVEGFLEVIKNSDHALRIADEIGYPVMIKASAGGGGKGLRIAWSAGEVAEGFERARAEAASVFGDDRLFIERFVVGARHIEIQVLGDQYGNIIHLGERECTIQRRNQKLVEEAPCPLLDEETRAAMSTQAVRLARVVNYDSAGTVEFLLGQDKSFYFLEMNTRLQVEHPVTEMVTGLDVVELMIRIAAGERLPLAQGDVKRKGCAIESRVCAEDPARSFLPSTGRIITYIPPTEGRKEGITIRNDTGVYEGATISLYYDSMISKLVTHAPTRLEAIRAQVRALESFALDGVSHNIPFLSALMVNPRWQQGMLSTSFIVEEFPDGFAPFEPEATEAHIFAAVAAAIDCLLARRRRTLSGRMSVARAETNIHERVVRLGGECYIPVQVSEGDGAFEVAFKDAHTHLVVSDWRPGQPVWEGAVDGAATVFRVHPVSNGFALSRGVLACEARVYLPREAELDRLVLRKRAAEARKVVAETSKMVLSPMPGRVISITVVAGQMVTAGDVICVVEAMKMENVLRAENNGLVAILRVREGDLVSVNTIILELV